jgi:hypothetical protein
MKSHGIVLDVQPVGFFVLGAQHTHKVILAYKAADTTLGKKAVDG